MKTKSIGIAPVKTCIIIPVYNEAEVIQQSIKSLDNIKAKIICVNDGSIDNTADVVRKTSAVLINHPFNIGQGAALQTGIDYALSNPDFEYFVTFDGDGQHSCADVLTMLEYIQNEKIDIVLGSRFLNDSAKNIPFLKKRLLKIAIAYSNITSRNKLTDTHNGLRVFNRDVAENINIRFHGMAHASEIIKKIETNGYSYGEVPVTINYSDYAKSKGQPLLNSINIAFDLIFDRFIGR